VDWREALLQFLFQTLDDAFLLDLSTRSEPSREPGLATGLGLRRALAEFLDSLELDSARQQVHQLEHWLDRKFTDRALTALVLCVAVLESRVRNGFVVRDSAERRAAVARTADFRAAVEVTLATAKRLGRALPEEETVNVAVQLLGAGVRKTLADLISSEA